MSVNLSFSLNKTIEKGVNFDQAFHPISIDDFLNNLENLKVTKTIKIDDYNYNRRIYHIEPFGVTMMYYCSSFYDLFSINIKLYGDNAEKLKEVLIQQSHNYKIAR